LGLLYFFGGIAPFPLRRTKAEVALKGKGVKDTISAACKAAVDGAQPLSKRRYQRTNKSAMRPVFMFLRSKDVGEESINTPFALHFLNTGSDDRLTQLYRLRFAGPHSVRPHFYNEPSVGSQELNLVMHYAYSFEIWKRQSNHIVTSNDEGVRSSQKYGTSSEVPDTSPFRVGKCEITITYKPQHQKG
jgi:hypothetical protein